MATSLSSRQIAGFEAGGYLAPIRALGEDEAAGYAARYDAFCARWPDHAAKIKTKAHILCPWIKGIARHPGVLDAFEGLLGPDIQCFNTGFRVKRPERPTHAGWHQDSHYSRIEPLMIVGALALTPISLDNGCLKVIPGSHRWGPMNHADSDDSASILSRGQAITDSFDDSAAVPLILRPGEIGFFDYRIVHGSGTNASSEPRVMMLIEMMAASARHATGRESAMLVRGEDRFGHFETDETGLGEATDAALAAWQRAVALRAGNLYSGATVAANASYGGAREAV